MSNQPASKTIGNWLKANLGKGCLAPLTNRDLKALQAAVQIVELWSYDRSPEVAAAFGLTVQRMQRQCRELAFHAVAHVMDWPHRFELWEAAELAAIENRRLCRYEPAFVEAMKPTTADVKAVAA